MGGWAGMDRAGRLAPPQGSAKARPRRVPAVPVAHASGSAAPPRAAAMLAAAAATTSSAAVPRVS